MARTFLRQLGIASLPFLLAGSFAASIPAQGVQRDSGHATVNGRAVFAAWNLEAGSGIPEDLSGYPEFLPNLRGWDFRINLPHVRYKLANTGSLAPASMVGVVEGPRTPDTLSMYGHRNNSIWLFQVDSQGRVLYKALPSSRSLSGSETRNVRSLTADWHPLGTEFNPIPRPPRFLAEEVAAAVVGEGIGVARVFVVARAEGGGLFLNHMLVEREDPGAWLQTWAALGWESTGPASLTRCFDGRLALAWVGSATGLVNVAIHTPATGAWSSPVEVAAAGSPPQLLWDGHGLHLLFVGSPTPVLRHTSATSATPLSFSSLASVSPLFAVLLGQFHATAFNERIHVAMRQDDGSSGPTRIFYSKSMTPAGTPSSWSAPSETGIVTYRRPRIAGLHHQIYAIATDPAERVVYSAKDMLSRGSDITGNFNSDRWTVSGAELVREGGQGFKEIAVLSFNGDIYLTASALGDDVQGFTTWIVNMSRAALKTLLTEKLGMRLIWGEPGGGPNELGAGSFARFGQGNLMNTMWPNEGEIPLIGDFDGDGSDDIARVTQKAEAGVGPAPVYVSLFEGGFQTPTLWHSFFSLDGEVPLTGDFDGDGKHDLVTFTQEPQMDAAGNLIGQAPVWVSISDGARFRTSSVWHTYFSKRGEIPLVGDFNGDGRDDIVTFVQKPQVGLGNAPVWVSLSMGNRFGPSSVWHPDFSTAGQVPMVGDFDGDGLDDIVTFAQEPQAGIGTAPAWVALSDGSGQFVGKAVWHTYFSPRGEIPRVADFDLDGKDDIITFLHGRGAPGLERVSFVALSTGSGFRRSQTWVSDFGAPETIPFIGHFTRQTLQSITAQAADAGRRFPDLIAFRSDGSVNVSFALANYPLPTGAPWERYKWFTDKGLGAALFPEWMWASRRRCLATDHRFALLGQAGTGGGNLTNVSVRMGSRQGHVLEEIGHSLFANCFRQSSDPFGLYAPIFVQHWEAGGVGASQIAAMCNPSDSDYYDCRAEDGPAIRTEHIFLHHMIQYVVEPEVFRERLRTEPNPTYRSQLAASYAWIKANWFDGLEFHRLPASGADIEQVGLQCGPGQCLATIPRRTLFNRGDANGSGGVDISDATSILMYLFAGTVNPECLEACDTNNDAVIDISDAVALLGYLFLGYAPPAAPGPSTSPCGADPDPLGSEGDLGCERYDACGG